MPATFQYFPYDTGAGSNVRGDRWREMFSWMRSNGIVTDDIVLNTTVSDLAVTPGTGLQVRVAEGDAFIQGTFFIQTGNFAELAISANSSGNPRIDLIVLSADFVANTTEYEVLTGTPAMSPVAPTPTQNDTLWQLPLYSLAVANGASSFITGNLTDLRVRSVQDSTGVTLTSDGGDESLVTEAIGPDLAIKGLTAGTNITLTPGMDDITIEAAGGGPGDAVCILSSTADETVFAFSSQGTYPFNTVVYDPGGMNTGTGLIQIPSDGIYQANFSATFSNCAAGCEIYIQEVLGGAIGMATTEASTLYTINISRLFYANALENFCVSMYNPTLTNLVSLGTSSPTPNFANAPVPFFSIYKVS